MPISTEYLELVESLGPTAVFALLLSIIIYKGYCKYIDSKIAKTKLGGKVNVSKEYKVFHITENDWRELQNSVKAIEKLVKHLEHIFEFHTKSTEDLADKRAEVSYTLLKFIEDIHEIVTAKDQNIPVIWNTFSSQIIRECKAILEKNTQDLSLIKSNTTNLRDLEVLATSIEAYFKLIKSLIHTQNRDKYNET